MNEFNVTEEENKITAVIEAIDFYTLCICGVGRKTVWGTGTPIKFNGNLYVLTALHILEDEPINKNLRFIPKAGVPLKLGSKNDIFRYPTSAIDKSYRISLPIINRIVSDEIDHLALLKLDPSAATSRTLNFYELKENYKTPPAGSNVGMLGFSREIARNLGIIAPNIMGVGVLPSFNWSKIVENENDDLRNFDDRKHFLIKFTKSEESCNPHGLSGCGIWASYISPGKIWSSNIRLVGVETHHYAKSQRLKATRIERVLELLKNN